MGNCLKGILFFWSLELSLLINSLKKEMLKPLFLQKLNSVGGSGVGRKRESDLSCPERRKKVSMNQTQKQNLNRFPNIFFLKFSPKFTNWKFELGFSF